MRWGPIMTNKTWIRSALFDLFTKGLPWPMKSSPWLTKGSIWLTKMGLVLCLGMQSCSCRGYFTQNTPIRPNPGMAWQPKFKPQRLSRVIPSNTVPWGGFSLGAPRRKDYLMDDLLLFDGVDPSGEFAKKIPTKWVVDRDFLLRGKQRYEIYCTPCHDGVGSGKGLVALRGFGLLPNFREQRLVSAADGHLYDVIKRGKGSMPSYAMQVPYDDRWAIVAYIRVLQQIPLPAKDSK